eukprot:CAMPEP_0171097214 /NCGR_PEP_ID=MMETSP0766_2-20121228/47271_1 /TAXON_ID=439317 /ORGANISM="Gambierdiscus australes, Strain CAWD 149" /LENGTH=189 /DNA_ID=CAMNT_0011556373 /DNA_START=63 /DNA_END=632 /DNA_ORIENTATION=+
MAAPLAPVGHTRRTRNTLAPALLLLALAAAACVAVQAAFVPPSPTQLAGQQQRRAVLWQALTLGAAAASNPQAAVAAGARWSGKYTDPKFPGCERKITKSGDSFIISGTSSSDGSKRCDPDAALKQWSITGMQPEGTFGASDTLIIDFSPRGGPKEVVATWDKDGILFPGGNKWTKKKSKPGTTGLVYE